MQTPAAILQAINQQIKQPLGQLHASQQTFLSNDGCDAIVLAMDSGQHQLRWASARLQTFMLARHSAERELNRVNERLNQLASEQEYKATHDPLTAIWNRSAIIHRITQTLQNGPAALIILDIDHFQKINDDHGHPVGDKVICELVSRIQKNLPDFASVGGEEFTILLPDLFMADAVKVAGTIHASLNAAPLAALPDRLITASLGVSWGKPGSDFDTLYSTADAALYDAKHHSRNRVFFR